MVKNSKRIGLSVGMLTIALMLVGQVKLPKLISDGMVLQRNVPLKIWGWAAAGEKVTLTFNGKLFSAIADKDGDWMMKLPKQTAGGPYKMLVKGSKNELEINDILIGDVWLASGQSNMEMPMRRVSPYYSTEIKNSECKFIRQFYVPQKYNFNQPEKDLESGSWKSVNPQNVLDFSAIAYFFEKNIYDKYKIPVGIINASLGGSPAEAWLSEEALKSFPEYYNEMQRFKSKELITKIEQDDNARIGEWYSTLNKNDEGNKSADKRWSQPELNVTDWKTMNIPGYWTDYSPEMKNGVVWFRKQIQVSASLAAKPSILILGRIVDADSVFVNGVFVGTTSYQYPPRRYAIRAGLLKTGENSIVVRVVSNSGNGGFVPDKQYVIESENDTLNLIGAWQYRQGAAMNPLGGQTFVRWKPGGLYNAMIAPLTNFAMKGCLWYQGESNTGKPLEYAALLTKLIHTWRANWLLKDLAFLYVQLPNFMKPVSEPAESNWALFREQQQKVLAVPNTAMAVAIDLGEWNDIHPVNKKAVADRLALQAQKIVYGNTKLVSCGPLYLSMKIVKDSIVLNFKNTGSGLIFQGDKQLNNIAIAGADKKFVWASAKIEKNRLIVWSEKIANPVAVRYAWADNPDKANLYNTEALPASPFRTDNWE
jgi:sialate O-acetylesterase